MNSIQRDIEFEFGNEVYKLANQILPRACRIRYPIENVQISRQGARVFSQYRNCDHPLHLCVT